MPKEVLKEITLDSMDETTMVPLKDLGFDCATGGGWPLNAICEIYGTNSSGKTTICFEAAYQFLKAFPKRNVYYYNYERSIDKFYVRNLLKNDSEVMQRFKIIEPEFLEDGMEHLLSVLDAKIGSLCIVDSLAAMTPKQEAEKALDKAQVGGFKAKLMAEVCRKIGNRIQSNPDTTVIFINHVNPVLGAMSFVPQKTTPGGEAVKFWASLRIEVSILSRLTKDEAVIGTAKKEKIPYGNVCRIKTEKNKFFPPFKRAVCYIIYGQGIDRGLSLIDYALALGIIQMKNKMDYFIAGKEDQIIRGKANFAEKINASQPLFDFLYNKIVKVIEEKRQEARNDNYTECIKSSEFMPVDNDSQEEPEDEEEVTNSNITPELEDEENQEDYLNDL